MNKSDFYYDLPTSLIAQTPLLDRSSSRLLVLDKVTGNIEHNNFPSIVDYLNEGDCLVLNDTRVIPARLYGKRAGGGRIEFLLLKKLSLSTWEVILKPGRAAKVGAEFSFGEGKLLAKVIEVKEDGNRIVEFSYEGVFEDVLDTLGQMPLPHYITEELEDKERYQTVYAVNKGSAAAPTAGLHFTNELLEEIRQKGVSIAYVTLHVGLGTFRPVKAEKIEEHHMHTEDYFISEENARLINDAKSKGKKVISVGTTSTRVLESVADENGILTSKSGSTNIFIYPPYQFKVVDSLITNFHLPESTLIMLVSTLSTREHVLAAYNCAVEKEYRFFSFGDAMLIK